MLYARRVLLICTGCACYNPLGLYVTYLRLSKHNRSNRNYGLEAQRRDLDIFLGACCPDTAGCDEVGSYLEIQSEADDDRPELKKAIVHCRHKGATLLVAKLDRLSRRVSFIAELLEVKGLEFKVACMPNADKFQLHIYAGLAEQEREFISQRTKAGLQRAKERGVLLGGIRPGIEKANAARRSQATEAAEKLRGLLAPMVERRETLRVMGEALEQAKILTSNGNSKWNPAQVSRVVKRLQLP